MRVSTILGSLAVGLATHLAAQAVPETLNYQGRLTDGGSAPVTGVVAMKFELFDDALAGAPLWSETLAPGVSVNGGVFSVMLGRTVPLPSGLFRSPPATRYLEITLNPGAGNQEILSPRQLVGMAPYAARTALAASAENAATVDNGLYSTGSYNDPAWLPTLAGAKITGAVPLAASATGFSGALAGDVTGGQSTTAVAQVGGRTAAQVSTSVGDTQAATATATPSTLVRRDASGNFSAGTVTAALNGTASSANSAPWSGLTGVPAGFADGVDDDSALAGRVGVPWTPADVTPAPGGVGQHSSITIGVDGNPLISYYDTTNGDLKIAHCDDPTCATSTTGGFAPATDVGQYTSLAIGTDGFGLVSFYDVTNGNLRVAHCANVACSSLTAYIVDSTGDVGRYSSLAIAANGFGVIAYYDSTNQDLKVANCSNTACSSSTVATLDSAGNVGSRPSVVLGPDGRTFIAYVDTTNQRFMGYSCGAPCSAGNTPTLIYNGNITGSAGTAAVVGADGMIGIATVESTGALRLHRKNPEQISGTAVLTHTLMYGTATPGQISLAVASDGQYLLAYETGAPALELSRCGVLCENSTRSILEGVLFTGINPSITIGADGLPVITHRISSGASTGLNLLRCGNTACVPNFRRR